MPYNGYRKSIISRGGRNSRLVNTSGCDETVWTMTSPKLGVLADDGVWPNIQYTTYRQQLIMNIYSSTPSSSSVLRWIGTCFSICSDQPFSSTRRVEDDHPHSRIVCNAACGKIFYKNISTDKRRVTYLISIIIPRLRVAPTPRHVWVFRRQPDSVSRGPAWWEQFCRHCNTIRYDAQLAKLQKGKMRSRAVRLGHLLKALPWNHFDGSLKSVLTTTRSVNEVCQNRTLHGAICTTWLTSPLPCQWKRRAASMPCDAVIDMNFVKYRIVSYYSLILFYLETFQRQSLHHLYGDSSISKSWNESDKANTLVICP